jgi:DNA-binding HxlR family transcriptional regulator
LSDPYASQKKTKAEKQRRILDSLRDEPARFGDLANRASVSATILTKHLKELQDKGLVTKRVEKGELVYDRTDKAKSVDQAARSTILLGLQKMKSLPQDPESLKFLSDLLNWAKEKPEYFETIVDWLGQLLNFMITSGAVTRLQNPETRRAFQGSINEKFQKPTNPISTPAEFRAALDKLFEAIKQTMTAKSE